MGFVYILMTVCFTVYGQLILKWQMSQTAGLPAGLGARVGFLLGMLWNPWVLSSFAAAFLGALAWMAALTRFHLSFAYPFMSLSFVMVVVLSIWLFGEPLNAYKVAGISLIVAGLVTLSRSAG